MPLVSWRSDGAVTRLTLNRPEALNALSQALADEFAAAVKRAAREKTAVVLLEGEGKAFCAGGDLGFIEDNRKRPAASLAPLMRRFYGSFLSIRALPQVVVAKVHGSAVGAGLCLALAADLRVVADDARLGFNFVRLGLNPGMAAWPLARAAFGGARARDLLFTGRFFSGRDLYDWGAASARAANAADLAQAAESFAANLAAASAESLRLLKDESRLGEDLAPFLAREARGQARTFKGADLAEGLAAVRERRPPRFPPSR
ncbi:MAG TPA: enoyl-CoA hydratase/isomerase family protein [Elusimicrobiota bacterium]|jgi:enoyl-CoA hydratase/carnithine racemase|nr:enoyl-CoA hydratase/isomerase family protein [Elusimicrobiota bacterium]